MIAARHNHFDDVVAAFVEGAQENVAAAVEQGGELAAAGSEDIVELAGAGLERIGDRGGALAEYVLDLADRPFEDRRRVLGRCAQGPGCAAGNLLTSRWVTSLIAWRTASAICSLLAASAVVMTSARSSSVLASAVVRSVSWPPISMRLPSMRAANSAWLLANVSVIVERALVIASARSDSVSESSFDRSANRL